MGCTRRDFLKATAGVTAGWAVPSFLASSVHAGDSRKKSPNIYLVMMDTLRADHCSCYGYNRDTTPTLDRLAKEGTLFGQHIASSCWTTPSIMSSFTGLSPLRHGVINPTCRLNRATPTLAATLKSMGYHTVGVVCNPCAAGKMGFDYGFDLYDDFTILLDYELNLFDVGHDKKRKREHVWNTTTGKKTADLVLKHIRKAPSDKPLFVFALFFDPHSDYVPPTQYAEKYDPDYRGDADGKVNRLADTHVYPRQRDLEHVKALYDAEIRYADEQVGRMLNGIEELGRLDDGDIVVYTSDHGEEFNEHGGLQHRRTLYEEVTHVPLVIRAPGRVSSGKSIDALTCHYDLYPSLIKCIGAKAPENLSETDLFRTASGSEETPRESVGLHLHYKETHLEAIRCPDSALIQDMKSGKCEWYDLAADPLQQEALAQGGAKANSLISRLKQWRQGESAMAAMENGEVEQARLTPQQIQALKAMGYIH